ncbi:MULTISPECIES: hypothetical protein [Fusobacterium]|uniref:hypothetical protein n=1 Tax=Fusobacterium TaxID=848 RepID=UPI001D0AF2A4|nr:MULTISPECIES: hypothetical protein [Fusobacterium]MCB8565163.1 hypothetical protein [Fusobacterium ulcerans]MCB8649166.1 hypothetical protein [Fusobacterium ulcerans]MDH6458310.1 hypothetical protein [Fusobacterium sp. PH5-7]
MRREIIKADNSNHVITITKKEEEITIEFDFELVPEVAPRFTLPLWAMGKEEEYEFEGGFVLKADDTGTRDVLYNFLARIKGYKELIFVCKTSDKYKGEFKYISQALKDNGIIMNGIRLNCIASIDNANFATMLNSTRNHQGNLIISTTFDTQRKKRFNITTVPLADVEYMLYSDIYCNTIEEFEKVLYSDIGGYKTFTLSGKDYTVILKDEVNESSQTAVIDGMVKNCKIYSFSLEEV